MRPGPALTPVRGALNWLPMGATAKTVKDFCAILGVSPSAKREEIQLAYVLRKRESLTSGEFTEDELKQAYEALANPGRRVASPGGRPSPVARPRAAAGSPPAVSGIGLLALLFGALAVVCGLSVWPQYGHRFRSFRPNDALVEIRTGKAFGTVLEVKKDYLFANGKVGAAYRVRLEPDGGEAWYPTSDIQYVCKRR